MRRPTISSSSDTHPHPFFSIQATCSDACSLCPAPPNGGKKPGDIRNVGQDFQSNPELPQKFPKLTRMFPQTSSEVAGPCPSLMQLVPKVTSIGSLPPKNLGKSRASSQNPAETPQNPWTWREPAEPSERQISWESLAEGCASDGDPPEL